MKVDVFKSKYAKNNETVDETFNRIASEISGAYYTNDSEKNYWTNRWKDELLNDLWRPGGSIIAGTNNPKKKISMFNCTTIPIKDDTLEAIGQARYECQKIAAYRQGVGLDFSNLRPKGTSINNSAESSEGVVSWMRSLDRIADEVGQKARKPAMLFSLKISHPDIIDFISCKDDIDVINNANISIQVTDDFMTAVKNDEDWDMTFRVSDNEAVLKTVKAKDLLNMIAKHSWKVAEPGIQFIDKMKKGSIQDSLGYNTISSNACSEAPLPAHGVCCLSSINMSKVPSIKSSNFESYIEEITKSLVRFMDNVNEYEIINSFKSPLKKQLEVVKDLRQIGIGITNLHQWLFNQRLEYDSDKGIKAVEKFFRLFYYHAFKASAELAKERGACPAWEKMFNSGGIEKLNSNITPFLYNIFKEFSDLEKLYYTTGIRNGSLLSIAPTGSLSSTFSEDVLSTGIEPLIGRCYWQKTRATTKGNHYDYYFRLPDTIKKITIEEMDKLLNDNRLGKTVAEEDYNTILNFPGSILDNNGKIGENIIEIINTYVPTDLLKTAYEIDPFKKVELISKVQKYVDASISVTFNIPHDFPVEDVEKLYMDAYDKGLKGLSIYRDGCREGILVFEFPKTAKEKEISVSEIDKRRPDDIITHHAPKRDKSLKCEIFNVLNHKVLVGLLNDKPYETFIVETDVKLPSNGHIIKKTKKKYVLTDEDNNVIIDNIIDRELINEEIKLLTRMTSMSLRHGTPIDFIISQLSMFSSDEKYPKAIANVLKKYNRLVLDVISDDKKCSECGELLVKHGGCMVCISCAGGKCNV
jgi:ribonucleoside-diphosphate reductase alpha chain